MLRQERPTLETIFLDECGHTGEDLADPNQPAFVIATHRYAEADCHRLKLEFFAGVQTPELKHKSLQGRTKNQERVLAFVEHALGARRCSDRGDT
jgi:hypothetical protein